MAAISSATTDLMTTTTIATSAGTVSTSTSGVVPVIATSSTVGSTTSLTADSLTTSSLSSSTTQSTISTTSSSSTLLASSSTSYTMTSSSSVSSSSLTSLSSSFSSASPTTTSSYTSSSSTPPSSSSSSSSSAGYSLSSITSSNSSAASASASSSSSGEITPLVRSLIIAAAVVGSFIALVLALGFVLRRQRHRRKTSGMHEMDNHYGSKSRDTYEAEDEREKYGMARGGNGYAAEGVFTQAMGRHHRPSSRLGGRSVEENQGTGYPSQGDHVHGPFYGGSEVSLFQPPLGVDQGQAWENRPFNPMSTHEYQPGEFYPSSPDLHRTSSPQPQAFNQRQPEDPYHSFHPSAPQFYTAYQAPTDATTTPSVIVTAPYKDFNDAQASNVALMYPQGSEAPAYQESVDPTSKSAEKTKFPMRSMQEESEEETSALQPGGPYSSKGIKMRVVRGFAASLEDELHVVPFTDLNLHQTYDDGWCLASTATGEQGMVPRDCLSLPDVLHGSTNRRTVSPTLATATSSFSSPSMKFASLAHDEPSAPRALPHIPVGGSMAWTPTAKTATSSPEAPQLADLEFSGRLMMDDIGSSGNIFSEDKGTPLPLSFSARAARRSSLVDSASIRARHE